ncbi:MAG: recognition motif [Aliidongia sp.]|jgi:RNA recognition motif-containing protein|nr:recognition motif [Aliidongia sp.]
MRAPNFHGNIVVSNLPGEFTATELAALFDDFGLVLGAQIDRAKAGKGSIILAPEPAVARAIAALNGQVFAGRTLKIAHAPAPPKRVKSAPRPVRAPEPADADRIAEAIRRFRATSDSPPVVVPVPTRSVVVEYRKTRRVEIPPRMPMAARG